MNHSRLLLRKSSGSRVGFRRIVEQAETLGEFRYVKSTLLVLDRTDANNTQVIRLARFPLDAQHALMS